MAEAEQFQPVIPFAGLLFIDKAAADEAISRMERIIGPIVLRSDPIDFEYTRYYEAEMGTGINRLWIGSSRISDPSALSVWKIDSGIIERELSKDGRRTVNIDPGFVGLSKVVLASVKDHPQRLPIENGVFAEIELTYRGKDWQELPWTYPDYADSPAKSFLSELRGILLDELKRRELI